MKIKVDWNGGYIESLIIKDKERISSKQPIFSLRLRNELGEAFDYNSFDGKFQDGLYVGIPNVKSVKVLMDESCREIKWRISVCPEEGFAVEYVDFPKLALPDLKAQDPKNGGKVLLPLNEGVLIDDRELRESGLFRPMEPQYPSKGWYMVFPNMMSSQLMGYVWDDCGIYFGAHDKDRGVKGIDFVCSENGITLRMRLYSGCDIGEIFTTDYDLVWRETDGHWESMGEIYRDWFESALPPRAKKIIENENLPDWYKDFLLVIAYPVKGWFDSDKMVPNALYPYTNALPILDEIKELTNSRIMALLMHWEGTAPWSPPYVWPPFGDVDNFEKFKESLHKNDDLLGVYCSGFGYTLDSKLGEYNREQEFNEKHLIDGMCAGPDGKVLNSTICNNLRTGYDICPASPVGREVVFDAYTPLFNSGVDYSQILDQNHGGGQYFCYSREHGHPFIPGKWMTENMQGVLSEWNDLGKGMLFGCESAAAEPFVGNLLLSDNRYELNYKAGAPVPLYSFIYHEYLHNFMGNQCSCPFAGLKGSLNYRIAYSFSIGDLLTLTMQPDGEFVYNWCARPTELRPDRKLVLKFISNLAKFYREKGGKYLCCGRMTIPEDFACETVTYWKNTLHAVHCTAWENGNEKVHILVNPDEFDRKVTLGGKEYTVPALNAILV